MKKSKKLIIFCVVVAILVGAGFAVKHELWKRCPNAQFERYCEGTSCPYAQKRLNDGEKKSFVTIRKHQIETGKNQLDAEILKVVSKEELTEISLKMRAALADEIRQSVLDNMAPRDKFAGNYVCMRQAYINELSNEEVLFLQSLKNKSLNDLQNPQVRQMYLNTSPKIMKCMNETVQQKYLEEVKVLTTPAVEEKKPAPKKKKAKKEAPKEEKKED